MTINTVHVESTEEESGESDREWQGGPLNTCIQSHTHQAYCCLGLHVPILVHTMYIYL